MSNPRRKSNPASVLVAVLLLLLVFIALIVVLRSCAAQKPESTPSPTPVAATQTPTATPSPTPEATPSPTPSPTATPAPTPSPTPVPELSGSGSFRSDTGTYLNLVAEWTASPAGDGKTKVTVTLYAESYSLQCRDIWHGGSVTLLGETKTFDTPAVEVKESGLTKTLLGSADFTLNLDGGADCTAVWAFRGSYGDKEIDSITAAGRVG
jgi:cytoskeletal protein RodZ